MHRFRCWPIFNLINSFWEIINLKIVESLQSHWIHTQSHWSSGSTLCFPSWETRFNPQGVTYVKPGFSCLRCLATLVTPTWLIIVASSEAGFVLGHHADNVIIPLDLTQLFCPDFTLAVGPPSGFTTDIVNCWGGALYRACNLTAFTHSLTGPVCQPSASRHEGPGFNPQRGAFVKQVFTC